MKNIPTHFFALFILLFGMTSSVQARTEAQLKASMAQRLPQIVALKQNGSVGENNSGYLTARAALSGEKTAIVAVENADRREVYQLIANKTKTSAATVAKTRASSIRSSAPAGTWVQLPDGTWKKA